MVLRALKHDFFFIAPGASGGRDSNMDRNTNNDMEQRSNNNNDQENTND
jgi:hypothetical protein